MFLFFVLHGYGSFLGTFVSNNNFFFVGKKDDRVTKLEITQSDDINATTAKITIQARFYQQSYQNSQSYLFCGYGYYWPGLSKVETHMYLDICKQSVLNEPFEYDKALNAGDEWPTKDQLKHNESINSNPDDCTFTFYAKMEQYSDDLHYIPADLYDHYSYLKVGKRLAGYVVSYDCGITFEFYTKQSVPQYQEFTVMICMVISILMLVAGLFTYNALKENVESDYIITGTKKLQNIDIYVYFLSTFYAMVSYAHIAFLYAEQLNRLIFCVFVGVLQLAFSDYRVVKLFANRVSLIRGQTSPWVQGLLFVLLLVVVIILSYCFIQEFYVQCHIIVLFGALFSYIFRLFKSLFSPQQVSLRYSQIFAVCSYFYLTNAYLYLTVYLAAGSNNSLHFYELGVAFVYFSVLSVALYAANLLVGVYLKYRRAYRIDSQSSPFCHSYLRYFTPDVYDRQEEYVMMPFLEPRRTCHNPYHAHSCYFNKQNLFLSANVQLKPGFSCFLLIYQKRIEYETCQICLESLNILEQRDYRFYDITVKYKNQDLPPEEPQQNGMGFSLGIQPMLFPVYTFKTSNNQQKTLFPYFVDNGNKFDSLYTHLGNFPAYNSTAMAPQFSEVEEEDFEHDEAEELLELGPPQPFMPFAFTNSGTGQASYSLFPMFSTNSVFPPSHVEGRNAELEAEIKVRAIDAKRYKSATLCILKCGHVFHNACMNFTVRSGNHECPICKATVVIPVRTCRRKQ